VKELEAYGVTGVLYAAAGFKSELICQNFTRSLFIKTNHPCEFLELFGGDTLLDGDGSAQWCVNSTDVLRWHVFDEDDASTPDQLRRADVERQIGLHVGVTIPTTALNNRANGGIGLAMAQVPASGFEAHWARFGADILSICALLDCVMFPRCAAASCRCFSRKEERGLGFAGFFIRFGRRQQAFGCL
jgi:hypothetical protein